MGLETDKVWDLKNNPQPRYLQVTDSRGLETIIEQPSPSSVAQDAPEVHKKLCTAAIGEAIYYFDKANSEHMLALEALRRAVQHAQKL